MKALSILTIVAVVVLSAIVGRWDSPQAFASTAPVADAARTEPSFPFVVELVVNGGDGLRSGTVDRFKVIARYSDGSELDVTRAAAWDTSNASSLEISAGGMARAFEPGGATVVARYAGRTATRRVHISK